MAVLKRRFYVLTDRKVIGHDNTDKHWLHRVSRWRPVGRQLPLVILWFVRFGGRT
ncbi:MAG: hypothetical protein QOI49_2660 [Verrucomicrobiota bacterium]|jgi:hypothetical protein